MDSLMALELRNRLQTGLKRSLPSMLTFDYPNIAALTDFLLRDLFPPVATPVQATAEPDEMLAQLQELSEDELRKQLDQELQAIDEGLFS
jgi:hypothetical protein